MNSKRALIAVNFVGFVHFLWDDIDILKEMGYDVFLVGDNEKNETETLKILESKGVTFYDIRIDSKSPISKNNVKAYYRYKEILRDGHFDLIHCHTPIVGLYMRMAAIKYRRRGTKVMYTTHGLPYTHLSSKRAFFKYHTIESFASIFCDAIITINMEDYESVKRLHCKKVFHINGVGVDTEKYKKLKIDREQYRKQLGISADEILILSIGELSIRKNHIVIVDAIAKLKDKDKYVFAICGRSMMGNGTEDAIKSAAKEKGVKVKFLGFRSDIPQIVHCADIGAIPSIREGLGLAGIETLSVGVPMIGSDVQGIKEYIINGETGFLCNPFSSTDFAEAIKKLSDYSYRASLKQNCMDIVEKFDKKISILQRQNIYKIILS